MITGLLRPDSGSILFRGHPWSRADLYEIGGLIETPPIYENLSAWENLKVRALILGEGEERMKEVLRMVDLTDTGKKPAGKFSLGMKQRLGIAIALLGRPKLLILDEPVNGLDPLGIQELRHLIRSFPELGITVLVSSHILSEIQLTADYYGDCGSGKRGELDEGIGKKLSENRRFVLVFKGRKIEIQTYLSLGADHSDACSMRPFIRNAYL